MESAILELLKKEKLEFVAVVSKFVEEQKKSYAALTPEFGELLEILDTYLLHGGKWHRPTLGLLAYRIADGREDINYRRQLAVTELIHRYLLIHDDVIDRDLSRHGLPTIEKIYQDRFKKKFPQSTDDMYSKGMAIVAGDVVNALTYELIETSGLDSQIMVSAMKGLNRLMIETSAGWQLQTEQNFMGIEEVDESAFITGMKLVSAQYSVVWPLRMGQIFAGRLESRDWDVNLDVYGENAGIAFQLTDDILGMFGDEQITGKPSGHDYREGKKTYLIIKSYSKANKEDKMFFKKTIGTNITKEQLDRVRQIMIDTGAVDDSEKKSQEHVEKAKQALKMVRTNDQQSVGLLADLAHLLANRDH